MPVPRHMACLRQPRANWPQSAGEDVADKLSTRRSPARGTGFLAVSGGTTPAHFFAELSKAAIDWNKVIVTLVDERLVPPASPRSNARLVADKLLQGPAAAAHFVPLYHGADDRRSGAQRWPSQALAQAALAARCRGARHGQRRPHGLVLPRRGLTCRRCLTPRCRQLVLPVEAASAGEPQADADAAADRRGRLPGAAHRRRRKAAGARAGARTARSCRSAPCSRLRHAGGDLLGR